MLLRNPLQLLSTYSKISWQDKWKQNNKFFTYKKLNMPDVLEINKIKKECFMKQKLTFWHIAKIDRESCSTFARVKKYIYAQNFVYIGLTWYISLCPYFKREEDTGLRWDKTRCNCKHLLQFNKLHIFTNSVSWLCEYHFRKCIHIS